MKARLQGMHATPWQTQLEEIESAIEVARMEEDGWIEDLLDSSEDESGRRSVSRVNTPMPNLRRASDDVGRKMASGNSWDEDFKAMQNHAASVLSKLGNGRG